MRNLFSAVIAAALLLMGSAASAQPQRFSVDVAGSGPDVILVPGLASPAEVWDATADHLRQRYRVHVVQLAGFGGLPPHGEADGPVVAPFVDELAAYIGDEALEAPAVIGHSLGGAAALMLAERHPAAVGRIMTIDALPFYALSITPTATVDLVRPMAEGARAQMLAQSPEQFAAGQGVTLVRMIKNEQARAALLPLFGRSDPVTVGHAVHELMTTDLRPALAGLRAPLTVLYAYDPAYGVPAETIDRLFADAYAQAGYARLQRIDDSFHFIMLDQPGAFLEAVDAFLK